jgi:hypothetical protein
MTPRERASAIADAQNALDRLKPLRSRAQFLGPILDLPKGPELRVVTAYYLQDGALWAHGVYLHRHFFEAWLQPKDAQP